MKYPRVQAHSINPSSYPFTRHYDGECWQKKKLTKEENDWQPQLSCALLNWSSWGCMGLLINPSSYTLHKALWRGMLAKKTHKREKWLAAAVELCFVELKQLRVYGLLHKSVILYPSQGTMTGNVGRKKLTKEENDWQPQLSCALLNWSSWGCMGLLHKSIILYPSQGTMTGNAGKKKLTKEKMTGSRSWVELCWIEAVEAVWVFYCMGFITRRSFYLKPREFFETNFLLVFDVWVNNI